jgi:signal transduction histidine kinase
MVAVSSSIFFIIFGSASYLVYKNMKAMHAMINSDFNQQQRILARQAASQVDAILQDLVMELRTLRKLRIENPESVFNNQMKAVVERNDTKGLIEVGFVGAYDDPVVLREGDVDGPFSAEGMQEDCGGSESEPVRLGPLEIAWKDQETAIVTSMLCATVADPSQGEGIIFIKVDVSGLIRSVTSSIRSGKTGYAWVIDESGMFLYHPEEDFIGENAFDVRKQREPYISYTQINSIMKDRMLQGEEGTGAYTSGWHRGIEGEMTKLIAFTAVRSTALAARHVWSVAVVAPVSEVEEAVHSVSMRNFIVEATLILGIFVFGLLVSIYQSRMSRALAEKVKQTEADLHETEQIYRRIVEQATDLIYILDLDMGVVLCNQLAAEVFSQIVIRETGSDEEQAAGEPAGKEIYVGRKLDELFRTTDIRFLRNRINEVLTGRKSIAYKHTLSVGERKIYFNTKLIPIRDDHNEIRYILGISRDVTETFELDQKIYNTEKLASIGTLAAGVAHEINNPLGVILGFTDLLKERFEEGSSEREDLETIEYNANYAKKVVQDLLGFARITEGLEDSVDVNQSIDKVMNIAKNTLMTNKIDLVMKIDEDLPKVSCDPREFQQIIFNLINNSVAAMKETGGTLELSGRADDQWVTIGVRDTGAGIPDQIKPRLFDPFFTTKKVSEGTGLGLSLCYGIVNKYGGRITFSSVSAEDRKSGPTGTTFYVVLPVAGARKPAVEPKNGEV